MRGCKCTPSAQCRSATACSNRFIIESNPPQLKKFIASANRLVFQEDFLAEAFEEMIMYSV